MDLRQSLKLAARQLSRNPGFTVTVVLTLALAIGVNTAIFSLVNALLLKSLPYPHPERMGTIYARTTGTHPSDSLTGMDGEKWELLRDNVPSLISAISGGMSSGVNLQAGQHAQYLHAGRVSAHYFDVLGLHPLLGRAFSTDEDRPHGPRAAILGFALWRDTFASNPNILGQPVTLKGEPYTIVGVLPENATTPLNADIYTALQPSRQGEGSATEPPGSKPTPRSTAPGPPAPSATPRETPVTASPTTPSRSRRARPTLSARRFSSSCWLPGPSC